MSADFTHHIHDDLRFNTQKNDIGIAHGLKIIGARMDLQLVFECPRSLRMSNRSPRPGRRQQPIAQQSLKQNSANLSRAQHRDFFLVSDTLGHANLSLCCNSESPDYTRTTALVARRTSVSASTNALARSLEFSSGRAWMGWQRGRAH